MHEITKDQWSTFRRRLTAWKILMILAVMNGWYMAGRELNDTLLNDITTLTSMSTSHTNTRCCRLPRYSTPPTEHEPLFAWQASYVKRCYRPQRSRTCRICIYIVVDFNRIFTRHLFAYYEMAHKASATTPTDQQLCSRHKLDQKFSYRRQGVLTTT